MIDLSNNNGPVNFGRLYATGQRRVYLKLTEGSGFFDRTHADLRRRALAAGFKVGEYHFARPSRSAPAEEARYFLRHLPKLQPGHALQPCLDFEDDHATPSSALAAWAVEWLRIVRAAGHHPVIYGSPSYLEGCRFKTPPAPLWLAAYGRNDGREHPFVIPPPWTRRRLAAHQFASTARVPGASGQVDLSRVIHSRLLDVSRLRR